jgi:hypothetical protein
MAPNRIWSTTQLAFRASQDAKSCNWDGSAAHKTKQEFFKVTPLLLLLRSDFCGIGISSDSPVFIIQMPDSIASDCDIRVFLTALFELMLCYDNRQFARLRKQI